jgi:hypothetical protein
MYERNQPDILATLGQMVQLAHRRANYNQNEVKEKLREYVQTDRRFKGYDLDRLVDRVTKCGQSGAKLDLSNPWLLPGGEKRPLSR